MLKTTRFRAFFAFPRPRHGPLVFRFRFNLLLFAFCKTLQKPSVFAPFFECGREPCGCFWAPQPKVLAIPAPTCGSKRLSGACEGPPCLKIHRKPRVFARFFAFLCYPTCIVLFPFLSKMLRKPHVFAYFWSRGGTVPCLLFRRFGLLALQKRHPKLILGISRAMHGPKKLIL